MQSHYYRVVMVFKKFLLSPKRKVSFSWRISVDGRFNWRNKAASSNSSGLAWTGSNSPGSQKAVPVRSLALVRFFFFFFNLPHCTKNLNRQDAQWILGEKFHCRRLLPERPRSQGLLWRLRTKNQEKVLSRHLWLTDLSLSQVLLRTQREPTGRHFSQLVG